MLRGDHRALDDQDVESGVERHLDVLLHPLGGQRRGRHDSAGLQLPDALADEFGLDGLAVEILHPQGGLLRGQRRDLGEHGVRILVAGPQAFEVQHPDAAEAADLDGGGRADHTVHGRRHEGQLEGEGVDLPRDVDVLGIAGAPVEVSLTRLTPESLSLMTWSESLVYGIGGTVAALVLALLVGLVMRIFKHRSTWLGAITVTAALAAFLGWAMSTVIAVPPALGADTKVWVNPLFAAGVGAVLGLVTRFFAGRPKDAASKESAPSAPAAPAADNDIEALLAEVGETKAP